MLQYLARRWLRGFSKQFQYDTRYMEGILEHDMAAFLKYSTINFPASHRKSVPLAPFHPLQ
jgi:hypothetical protein